MAGFAFLSLSGVYLFAYHRLDFRKYFVMDLHIVVGFACFYLFFLISFLHLQRLYPPKLLWKTFLAAFCFYALLALQFWPPLAFILSALMLFYLAVIYLRHEAGAAKIPLLTGVLAWTLLNLLLATGAYMAGPMKSFRTNMFNTIHMVIGLVGPPIVLYHFLLRLPDRWSRKKLQEGAVLVGLSFLLLAAALLRASWYEKRHGARSSPALPRVAEQDKTTLASLEGPFSMKNPATCGQVGCHTEIYKQWRASTHRFAAANLAYRRVFERFVQAKGAKAGAFCERCHNPDLVNFPQLAAYPRIRSFFTQRGVTCLSCHIITDTEASRGNGRYTIAHDQPYLSGFVPRNEKEWFVLKNFIRQDLRHHRKSFNRPLYKTAAFCAACHRLTIPTSFNGRADLALPSPLDSYEKSPYPQKGISCVHCHLQLYEFYDPQSMDKPPHARPDHRMLGINVALPAVAPKGVVAKQELSDIQQATRDFLAGRLGLSRYEHVFLFYTRDPRHPAYTRYFHGKDALEISIAGRFSAGGADELRLTVRTTNARIGHSFPSGLHDLSEVWLELKLFNQSGQEIFSSGVLDAEGNVPPEARTLGGALLDKRGDVIADHRIWEAVELKGLRVIAPQKSIEDNFRIPLPAADAGPFTVQARWLYRRYNPLFARQLFGDRSMPIPIAVLGSAKVSLGSAKRERRRS